MPSMPSMPGTGAEVVQLTFFDNMLMTCADGRGIKDANGRSATSCFIMFHHVS